jgi:biotin transport system substrate-specific component
MQKFRYSRHMPTLQSSVLIDVIVPRWGHLGSRERRPAWLRESVLLSSFALLTAAAAQIRIPLGFTPVPVTGQTMAVLLAGAALGAKRGAASQLVYWLLGMIGLPFYAAGAGGWEAATGATMGYFVGFIAAAGIVGRLAEYRQDRNILTSLSSMALGSIVIYICGATWLSIELGIPIATGERNAIELGVAPFLLGDIIKMCLAGMTTASAWGAVNRFSNRS